MGTYFIAYVAGSPAAININGHRLLIVSSSKEDITPDLGILGGSEIREITLMEDETDALADLAASINGGVVLAPPGVRVASMINSLESELPWLH